MLDNIVRPDFDFAAVVANTLDSDANITVTRNGATVATAVAPANGLVKVYLPWVEALKSLTPANGCPTNVKLDTVSAPGGGYHLTSDKPVAVYQFNAIEYAGRGGPPGKDWSSCQTMNCFHTVDCYSYTNDASLLLPTTALTSTYRVAGPPPWKENTSSDPNNPTYFTFPAYFSVTGTQAGTTVTVKLSQTGAIQGGGGVPMTPFGGTATFQVGAGDVVLVVGTPTSDSSGTLVTSTAPIQVLAGISCTYLPHDVEACDHVEESVMPAETLGKHYFVARPTGPTGAANGQIVRIFGNVDGTQLTYPGTNPGGPTTIDAGQVVDLGVVSSDFEIVGDHEFIVGTFMVGAGANNGARDGDPSQSFATTVEQFRLKYVFLAPRDYDKSFVDVVGPVASQVTLDGAPLGVAFTPLSSGFGVARVALGAGNGGAHVLESDQPVGVQVLGYGAYTSYQYPGGLNLGKIAPPPVH